MSIFQNCNKRQFKINRIGFAILAIISLTYISCTDNYLKPHPYFPQANDFLRHADTASLHFFVLSDWGFNGGFSQKDVAAEMAQISKLVGISFILTCGDNFQYTGVDSVNDPLWKDNYENIYNDSALHIPWYPSLGNHDYYGNPDAEIAYSSISKYWEMPSRYYTFTRKINTRGNARFIVLDTQGLINSYQGLSDTTLLDSIPQYSWVKKLLSESTEKWIFVTGHHPVFSASSFHGDTYEMKKLIKPLFDQYKVDFYICGHDHDFEHTKDKANYTDYIVTGTGGYVRPEGRNERTMYSMSAPGFSYLSVGADTVKLYFITAEGKIGYSLKKTKSTLN
ncbi:MAG TPA: metallophosphoesterase [Paludibacter sp.]